MESGDVVPVEKPTDITTLPPKTKKINISACRGRIIVREDEFKYEGRIVIPDKAKRRSTTGRVIAVGADVTDFKIGDRIVYAQYSGTGMELRGHENIMFRALGTDEPCAIIGDDEELLQTTA